MSDEWVDMSKSMTDLGFVKVFIFDCVEGWIFPWRLKYECAIEGGRVYLVGGSPTSDIPMSQGRRRKEP